MKQSSLIIALFLLFSYSGFSQVNFETISIEEALAKAEKEQKNVFIDVYTTWCGPCKRMDENVFSRKDVGERMAKEYIALKIDNERSPYRDAVGKYGIKGYPTMLILDSKGKEIGRIYGSRSPEGFMSELDNYSPQKAMTVSAAFEAMQNHPADRQQWKAALKTLDREFNALIKEGRYRDFLNACQAYFENFDISALEDTTDYMIFRNANLSLEHPVVQFYLNDSTEYGQYKHKDYMILAFKKEAEAAGGDKQTLADIKQRVSDYYDIVYEKSFGDVESKADFMSEIFK
jgi:thioredoxin-related protein